jgi:cytochrome c oxidase cbb3-type subunit 3
VLALCAGPGCVRPSGDNAQQGARPAVEVPVGPVPGPNARSPADAPNPFPADEVTIVEGRRLFQHYNCDGCHGGRAGGGMAPSLRDADWIYGQSDAHIFDSIAHGRAHGMPSWGTRLPEAQIWKLVAYVKSLRTAAEPDKPPPLPAPMGTK